MQDVLTSSGLAAVVDGPTIADSCDRIGCQHWPSRTARRSGPVSPTRPIPAHNPAFASAPKCRVATARPEPDLRYLSKRAAADSSGNSIETSHAMGDAAECSQAVHRCAIRDVHQRCPHGRHSVARGRYRFAGCRRIWRRGHAYTPSALPCRHDLGVDAVSLDGASTCRLFPKSPPGSDGRERRRYAGNDAHLRRLKDTIRRGSARRWNKWRQDPQG